MCDATKWPWQHFHIIHDKHEVCYDCYSRLLLIQTIQDVPYSYCPADECKHSRKVFVLE